MAPVFPFLSFCCSNFGGTLLRFPKASILARNFSPIWQRSWQIWRQKGWQGGKFSGCFGKVAFWVFMPNKGVEQNLMWGSLIYSTRDPLKKWTFMGQAVSCLDSVPTEAKSPLQKLLQDITSMLHRFLKRWPYLQMISPWPRRWRLYPHLNDQILTYLEMDFEANIGIWSDFQHQLFGGVVKGHLRFQPPPNCSLWSRANSILANGSRVEGARRLIISVTSHHKSPIWTATLEKLVDLSMWNWWIFFKFMAIRRRLVSRWRLMIFRKLPINIINAGMTSSWNMDTCSHPLVRTMSWKQKSWKYHISPANHINKISFCTVASVLNRERMSGPTIRRNSIKFSPFLPIMIGKISKQSPEPRPFTLFSHRQRAPCTAPAPATRMEAVFAWLEGPVSGRCAPAGRWKAAGWWENGTTNLGPGAIGQ